MGILDGVRVLDAGTVLAAPGISALLADFGADVIKIEQPGVGDPLRTFSPQEEGQGLVSKVTNRGKRSVTLDLSQPEGRELFLGLVAQSDAVVMNYRMSAVKKWGIDYEDLRAANSSITVLHLTGYGRTGPYADRPGFARVSEAFIGLTYTTGYPDRAPVPAGYAIADAMGGVFGAFAVVLALYEKQASGLGQLIDLSLYEGLAKSLDGMYIGALAGHGVPERTGTSNPTIAPHDIYPMGDGEWVSLPVSTQSMFVRLCEILDVPQLVLDERFRTNQARVANRGALDDILRPLFERLTAAEFLDKAHGVGIAAAAINDALDFATDPHVVERETFQTLWDPNLNRHISFQGVVPRLSRTPGKIERPGEELGQSTDAVLQELLKLQPEDLERLRAAHVI